MHFGLPRRVVALASLVLLDAPVLISLLVSSVAVAARWESSGSSSSSTGRTETLELFPRTGTSKFTGTVGIFHTVLTIIYRLFGHNNLGPNGYCNSKTPTPLNKGRSET